MKLELKLKLVGRCRVTLVLLFNGSHMYGFRSPKSKDSDRIPCACYY